MEKLNSNIDLDKHANINEIISQENVKVIEDEDNADILFLKAKDTKPKLFLEEIRDITDDKKKHNLYNRLIFNDKHFAYISYLNNKVFIFNDIGTIFQSESEISESPIYILEYKKENEESPEVDFIRLSESKDYLYVNVKDQKNNNSKLLVYEFYPLIEHIKGRQEIKENIKINFSIASLVSCSSNGFEFLYILSNEGTVYFYKFEGIFITCSSVYKKDLNLVCFSDKYFFNSILMLNELIILSAVCKDNIKQDEKINVCELKSDKILILKQQSLMENIIRNNLIVSTDDLYHSIKREDEDFDKKSIKLNIIRDISVINDDFLSLILYSYEPEDNDVLNNKFKKKNDDCFALKNYNDFEDSLIVDNLNSFKPNFLILQINKQQNNLIKGEDANYIKSINSFPNLFYYPYCSDDELFSFSVPARYQTLYIQKLNMFIITNNQLSSCHYFLIKKKDDDENFSVEKISIDDSLQINLPAAEDNSNNVDEEEARARDFCTFNGLCSVNKQFTGRTDKDKVFFNKTEEVFISEIIMTLCSDGKICFFDLIHLDNTEIQLNQSVNYFIKEGSKCLKVNLDETINEKVESTFKEDNNVNISQPNISNIEETFSMNNNTIYENEAKDTKITINDNNYKNALKQDQESNALNTETSINQRVEKPVYSTPAINRDDTIIKTNGESSSQHKENQFEISVNSSNNNSLIKSDPVIHEQKNIKYNKDVPIFKPPNKSNISNHTNTEENNKKQINKETSENNFGLKVSYGNDDDDELNFINTNPIKAENSNENTNNKTKIKENDDEVKNIINNNIPETTSTSKIESEMKQEENKPIDLTIQSANKEIKEPQENPVIMNPFKEETEKKAKDKQETIIKDSKTKEDGGISNNNKNSESNMLIAKQQEELLLKEKKIKSLQEQLLSIQKTLDDVMNYTEKNKAKAKAKFDTRDLQVISKEKHDFISNSIIHLFDKKKYLYEYHENYHSIYLESLHNSDNRASVYIKMRSFNDALNDVIKNKCSISFKLIEDMETMIVNSLKDCLVEKNSIKSLMNNTIQEIYSSKKDSFSEISSIKYYGNIDYSNIYNLVKDLLKNIVKNSFDLKENSVNESSMFIHAKEILDSQYSQFNCLFEKHLKIKNDFNDFNSIVNSIEKNTNNDKKCVINKVALKSYLSKNPQLKAFKNLLNNDLFSVTSSIEAFEKTMKSDEIVNIKNYLKSFVIKIKEYFANESIYKKMEQEGKNKASVLERNISYNDNSNIFNENPIKCSNDNVNNNITDTSNLSSKSKHKCINIDFSKFTSRQRVNSSVSNTNIENNNSLVNNSMKEEERKHNSIIANNTQSQSILSSLFSDLLIKLTSTLIRISSTNFEENNKIKLMKSKMTIKKEPTVGVTINYSNLSSKINLNKGKSQLLSNTHYKDQLFDNRTYYDRIREELEHKEPTITYTINKKDNLIKGNNISRINKAKQNRKQLTSYLLNKLNNTTNTNTNTNTSIISGNLNTNTIVNNNTNNNTTTYTNSSISALNSTNLNSNNTVSNKAVKPKYFDIPENKKQSIGDFFDQVNNKNKISSLPKDFMLMINQEKEKKRKLTTLDKEIMDKANSLKQKQMLLEQKNQDLSKYKQEEEKKFMKKLQEITKEKESENAKTNLTISNSDFNSGKKEDMRSVEGNDNNKSFININNKSSMTMRNNFGTDKSKVNELFKPNSDVNTNTITRNDDNNKDTNSNKDTNTNDNNNASASAINSTSNSGFNFFNQIDQNNKSKRTSENVRSNVEKADNTNNTSSAQKNNKDNKEVSSSFNIFNNTSNTNTTNELTTSNQFNSLNVISNDNDARKGSVLSFKADLNKVVPGDNNSTTNTLNTESKVINPNTNPASAFSIFNINSSNNTTTKSPFNISSIGNTNNTNTTSPFSNNIVNNQGITNASSGSVFPNLGNTTNNTNNTNNTNSTNIGFNIFASNTNNTLNNNSNNNMNIFNKPTNNVNSTQSFLANISNSTATPTPFNNLTTNINANTNTNSSISAFPINSFGQKSQLGASIPGVSTEPKKIDMGGFGTSITKDNSGFAGFSGFNNNNNTTGFTSFTNNNSNNNNNTFFNNQNNQSNFNNNSNNNNNSAFFNKNNDDDKKYDFF